MTRQAFYRTVSKRIGRTDPEAVQRAMASVFHALRDRLTPEEADHVAAQLPHELKVVWEAGEKPERRPLKIHRDEFYERVREDAGLGSRQEARWVTLAVFSALKQQLSPGEAEDVFAQLPKDLKETWMEAEGLREMAPRVRDIMTRDPISIDPDAPLGTAVDVMQNKAIRHLPVVDDGGQLMGIVTDRDLRSAAFAPAIAEQLSLRAQRRLRGLRQELEELQVRDAMTWVVATTHPEATIAHAAAIMFEARIGSLPVVQDRMLVGILTERDVLKALAEGAPELGHEPLV